MEWVLLTSCLTTVESLDVIGCGKDDFCAAIVPYEIGLISKLGDASL